MKKSLITSKFIIDKCEESQFITTRGSDLSQTVDSDPIQDLRLKSYQNKKLGLPDSTITINFNYDPLSGTCSWSEVIEGEEVGVLLTLSEIDFWQYSFQYYNYTTFPGIQLTIKRGSGTNIGRRLIYDPGKVKNYIYAPSYRSKAEQLYQEFSTLVNRARVRGLEGIQFPKNWDPIPYTV